MTRQDIFLSMPDALVDMVHWNMMNQNVWKDKDDEEYEDEFDFLMGAFAFHETPQPRGFWEDYITHLMLLDTLLGECLGDE